LAPPLVKSTFDPPWPSDSERLQQQTAASWPLALDR
jgi:hypothetical protein